MDHYGRADGRITLTIIAITVIGVVLGAVLAVWIVRDAISNRPTQPIANGQPQVLELRQDSGQSDASVPGPAAPTPTVETAQPTPTQPQTGTTAKVGETITINGLNADTKIAVTLNRVIPTGTAASQFLAAKPGRRLAAVELTIKNVGTVTYSDSPITGGVIIDADGQQHRTTLGGITEGTSFGGSVTIGPNDSRKGVIVFDVPEAAVLAKLQFGPTFAQKGEWLLFS